ncbi:DNA binding protein inhibitor ID 3 [Trichuris trichiura]|uniref:DNA binding protein inhibitor ID 3 n=1 Tax=Trichuris trichiura TaxID=36087 RepID=A0A077Z9Y7_TRITR|nr:DNA binding protein inhibitor ID 3 [Trichuris trichiura]
MTGCQKLGIHPCLRIWRVRDDMSVRRRTELRRLRTRARKRLDTTRLLEALVYKRLRAMVPGVPKKSPVTKMQLLQHVLDYIYDLQEQLREPVQPEATPVTVEGEDTQFSADVLRPLCR